VQYSRASVKSQMAVLDCIKKQRMNHTDSSAVSM
jgi:hypothetical protein